MEEEIRRPRFLIVSPPQYWGGPIVLHLLCRMLAELGYDAKIFMLRTDVQCPLSRQEFLRQYLPFMNGGKAPKIPSSQEGAVKGCVITNYPYVADDTIVVYPEIVFGNPLAAKHAVRWFLNVNPFKDTALASQAYGKDDLFICYREVFNDYQLNPTCRQVKLSHFNYDLYKRWNYGEREGSCFIIRKGANRPDLPPTVPGVILDDLSDEEKVKIMNQCKYCYSYDTQTFYSIVATICGCISVVIPEPGKKREDYLTSGEKGWGRAYGTTPDEIEFARSTYKELVAEIDSYNVHNQENVQKFLGYCKEYFQERMDAGINW